MELQNSRALFRGSHEKIFLHLQKGSGEGGRMVGLLAAAVGLARTPPSLCVGKKKVLSSVRQVEEAPKSTGMSPQASFRPSLSSPPPARALLESGRKTNAACLALCLAVHNGCYLSLAFFFVGTLPEPYPASSLGDTGPYLKPTLGQSLEAALA